MLDNFFKNFFRQCKEPSRFGFYRIAADQAENLLEVMKQLLKDPEVNKDLLAPHKVDTSGYEKKVQEEQAAQQTVKQEPQKQENMEQQKEQQESPQQTQGKRGYQPIDENKINWQELEDRWGVKRDDLEKSGDLTKMLNYGKSDLVKVKPTFGGESFELDARLSFKKDGEGMSASCLTSSARSRNWMNTRNTNSPTMTGRTSAKRVTSAGSWTSWIGKRARSSPPTSASTARRMRLRTSRQTGCASRSASARRRSPRRERDMLRAGLPVRDKLIERNDGRKFVTTLQVNVEQRGVEFVPGTGRSPRTAQTQETKGDTSKSQVQGGENAAQPRRSNAATRGRTRTAASAPSANGAT